MKPKETTKLEIYDTESYKNTLLTCTTNREEKRDLRIVVQWKLKQ